MFNTLKPNEFSICLLFLQKSLLKKVPNLLFSSIEQHPLTHVYGALAEIHLSSGRESNMVDLIFQSLERPLLSIHPGFVVFSYVQWYCDGADSHWFVKCRQFMLLSHCLNVFIRFYYMQGSTTYVFFVCKSHCTGVSKRKREQNSNEQNRALKDLQIIENKTKDHPMMSSCFPSVSFSCRVIVIPDFPSHP